MKIKFKSFPVLSLIFIFFLVFANYLRNNSIYFMPKEYKTLMKIVDQLASKNDLSEREIPFTITSGTQKIDTRARAREISLKIENTSTSQFWKLGTFRIDYQPDGRR